MKFTRKSSLFIRISDSTSINAASKQLFSHPHLSLPLQIIKMSEVNKGNIETIMLKANITDQLNRLLTQLEDLEELKDELEQQEYIEEKEETLAQLREFQTFLDQTVAGNMTLTDAFDSAREAIQAAISQAFKTPEVLRLFANKDSGELRKRLVVLERDLKLRAINQDLYNRHASEVLLALRKMGESLTPQEEELLARMGTSRHLENANVSGSGAAVMSSAAAGIKSASK